MDKDVHAIHSGARGRGTFLISHRKDEALTPESTKFQHFAKPCCTAELVGGGDSILLENVGMSGRHGVQYVAQCVACAAMTLDVGEPITNLSAAERSTLRNT